MKLFKWTRHLIVAEDEKDVRKLLRELSYEAKEIRQFPVCAVRKPIRLSIDNGDTSFECSPREAAARCGRGIIPEC